jgi:uncharacterized membrane protein YcaP (DUF421 family)
MNSLLHNLDTILGLNLEPRDLTFLQISLRGIIVFLAAIVMLRVGDRRFLSKRSAFDAVVGFILASMLARAVNGSSAFLPTIGGGFVIVALHRVLAFATRDSHWLGNLIKGEAVLIVKDGVVKKDVMRRNDLSEHDLLEDARFNGNVGDPSQIKEAYYERNGNISIVRAA